MNVFSGPDSLKDYYDPDKNPPLPLVEIPQHLNPYYAQGVRIYAKMMTMLPAHNVKELPALSMLSGPGAVKQETSTVVEYSSGSTVISMGILARVLFGINDTKAYISNKTSASKLRMLQFFGLELHLYGGPSQPDPTDHRGGIQQARKKAEECPNTANPNQYENDLNWKAHSRWTGPQILSQLPEIDVMCAGMGTAGTLTGIATYLKEKKPSITCVGVCTAPGDRVPGPRSHALLAPVKFPWAICVDEIVECASAESYTMSLHLTREGLICGPSSGFNLVGLLRYLERKQSEGSLETLRNNATGLINCAFICCDLPYQYIPEYFEKVASSEFQPIGNQRLTEVDLYRYDDAWELCVDDQKLHLLLSDLDTVVLDLRDAKSHQQWSPKPQNSVNMPLVTHSSDQESPFFNSRLLEMQWHELNQIFGSELDTRLRNNTVLLLCHNGDTARVATSILRSKAVNCFSVKGGTKELQAIEKLPRKMDSPMREMAESSV